MRVLTIDDAAKEAVKRVLDFAHQPENFYRVGPNGFSFQRPPGDDPRHVAQLDTYRCVFSVTKQGKREFRHLSISVPSDKYPNVFAAFTIAEMFGFRGWDGKTIAIPDGWIGRVSEEEHCVVLGQEM